MPHRDPRTGQFLSHDETEFEDVEVASFGFEGGVVAAALEGGTGYGGADEGGFRGGQLIDYDEIVDRGQELHLLEAQHRMSVWQNSTATEDGSFRVYAEISTAGTYEMPELRDVDVNDLTDDAAVDRDDEMNGQLATSDGIDLVGRPLVATAIGQFYNAGTGAGGGSSAGEDSYVSDYFPGEMGRFHGRDELNLNLGWDASNIDDAGVHVDISGQHVYGVLPHEH